MPRNIDKPPQLVKEHRLLEYILKIVVRAEAWVRKWFASKLA